MSTTNLSVNKLQPNAGYVLVEPAKQEKQTSAGIYLPDSHTDKPQYGTVLAVGADQVSDKGGVLKAPVKTGDTVVYKKWGGNEVQIGDIEYQFLRFDDILAVVSK
jgi:chaperonin GroES